MAFQDLRSAWQPHMRVERDSETGVYRSTVTIHDQFRDVAGQWAETSENWADTSIPDMADAVLTLSRMGYAAAENGKRRWYPRITHLDQWVEFGRPQYWTGAAWQNVPLGLRVRDGRKLIWDRPHFSLEIEAVWNRLSLKVVLKDLQAAARLRWPVSLYNLQWDNWTVKDGLAVVGRVRPPRIMWHGGVQVDEDGDPIGWNGRALNVSYSGGYVEFTANLSGLSYPIEIWNTDFQPDEAASKDTWLDNQNVDTNNDTVWFKIRQGAKAFRTIIEYDCSGIDGGDVCSSAVHTLNQEGSISGVTHYVNSIASGNEDWVEAEATWNVRKTATGWAGSAGCSTSGTDYEATQMGSWVSAGGAEECSLNTTRVEGWFGESNTNYGILCRSETDTLHYYSDATDTTASQRPKLVVVHEAGGVAKNKTPLITHLRRMMAA